MAPDRPNVLFIISDQHRYTSLGHRDDGDPVSTPALDRLFSNGAYFATAYAGYPICTPSRLCLLTGKQAPEAGAWDNKSTLLPDRVPFPQTFSDSGYETCLQGKMHLGGNRQFAGFDRRPYGDLTGWTGQQFDPPSRGSFDFDQKMLLTGAGVTSIPESLLQEQTAIRESLSFIREITARGADTPWLLCASLNRPHWPRTAPRRYFERHWPSNLTLPWNELGMTCPRIR